MGNTKLLVDARFHNIIKTKASINGMSIVQYTRIIADGIVRNRIDFNEFIIHKNRGKKFEFSF
jgi:hypothetical protein